MKKLNLLLAVSIIAGTMTAPIVRAESSVIMEDDFESAATLGNYTVWGGSGQNLAGKLNLDATDTWGTMILPNDQHGWTDGIINAAFKMKVSGGVGLFSLRNDTTETGCELLKLDNGKVLVCDEETGSFENDKWYNAEVSANLTTGEYSVKLLDGANTIAEKSGASDTVKDWTADRPLFQNWGGITQVDDVDITYTLDGETVDIVKDDFESASTLSNYTIWGGSGKYLAGQLNLDATGTWGTMILPNDQHGWTDGVITASFDMKVESGTALYSLRNDTTESGCELLKLDGTSVVILDEVVGSFETGRFYTGNVSANLTTGEYSIKLLDGANPIVEKSGTSDKVKDWTADRPMFQNWGGIAKVDNARVTYSDSAEEPEQPTDTVPPAESEQPSESAKPTETIQPSESAKPTETIPPSESEQPSESAKPTETIPPSTGIEWTDDFDSYNSTEDLTGYSIPDWSNAGAASIITNGSGKVLQLNPAKGTQASVIRELGEASGKVGVDVEIIPAEGPDNKIVFSDSSWGNETLISCGKTAFIVANGEWITIGSMTPGRAYTVRAIVDTDAHTFDVAVINTADGIISRASTAYNGTNVGYLQLAQGAWEAVGAVVYDNLKITASPEALPEPVQPTEDPNVQKTLWEDDFESYNDISDAAAVYGVWPDVRQSQIVTDNGSKVLKVQPNASKTDWQQATSQFEHQFDKIYSTGKIGISYSFKPVESGNMNFIVRQTGGFEAVVPRAASGSLYIGQDGDCWDNNFGMVSSEQWYDAKAVIDLDADTVTIDITDKNGNTRRGSYAYTGNFDTFAMGVYSESGSSAEFDNLKIVTNPEPLPELKELPFTDDFESYETIDDAGANWAVWAPETNTNPSKLITTEKGKSYYLGLSQGTDNTSVTKNFVSPLTSGRIKVSFDIIPGANVGTHVKFEATGTGENSSFLPVFYFQNGEVGTAFNWIDANAKIGTYRDGEWLHCSAVIDIDNGTIYAEVEDGMGNIQTQSVNHEQLRDNSIDTLTAFAVQEWAAAADKVGSVFDNVRIEYDTSVPVLNENRIAFRHGPEETKNLSAVPADCDTVLLNFGTAMDTESCAAIKITEKGTGAEAKYELSTDGSRVALVLTEALKPLTEYNIYVPATAANIIGEVMGVDANIAFTTGGGALGGIINGASQNDIAVTRLSQLKPGAKLDISYEAANATTADGEAVLIVAYYNGNEMTSVEFEKTALASGERISKTYAHTVGELDGVTGVKIMLWDGFNSIVPIAQSLELK